MEKKGLHVGIILDGNRRFAKRVMKEPWKGHKYGAQKVEKLFFWCQEFNIKELTIYALSTENFKRPEKELNFLMKLFKEEFKKIEKDPRIAENKIRIKFIGEKNQLDKELQRIINDLEKATEKNNKYQVNIALAYGGRQEVIYAIKELLKKKQKISEENFEKNLYLKNSPDLIIRTGGEKRTSNFLPWQSVYSEWFFLEKMWPEFNKEDLKKVIREYYQRERKFGR